MNQKKNNDTAVARVPGHFQHIGNERSLPGAIEWVNFFNSITDNIYDPAILTDPDFRIMSCNNAFEGLFECKSNEAIGHKISDFQSIGYPSETKEQILKSFKRKGNWQGELICETQSRGQLNIQVTASQFTDMSGQIRGNLFLIRDITSQKKAEEKLKEYKHFFDNSNDFSCIANTEGYFEIVNPSFNTVLGYSQNELSENPFLGFVHPDDIPATLVAYEQLKSGALIASFVNRYRKRDGSYLWFDWNATPSPITGKLYCIARDITDRKIAEDELGKLNEDLEETVKVRTEEIVKNAKRFRTLVENGYDIISLFDASLKAIYRSPSVSRVLGWPDAEMKPLEGIENVHPEDKRYAKRIFIEAIKSPGKIVDALFRRRHKDGHYIWLEGVVTNLLHDEDIKAIVLNFRDISERIEAEKEVKLLNENLEHIVLERTMQLEEANKELDSFSYSVSHDLRAPLRGISGYSKILMEDFGPHLAPDAIRILNKIVYNATKMGHLIDDLLAFSRLGKKELVIVEIQINSLVSQLCDETKLEFPQRNINFIVHNLMPALGDSTLIKQLWINLISNAVKYTQLNENTTIEIGCDTRDGKIIYHIKDNGVGFDIRYADKLFGVFQRLHSEKEFDGSGVGLAIVHRIVTRHGGRIWAESTLNEGSQFYFTLNTKRHEQPRS